MSMRLFIGLFPPKHYLDFFRDALREFDKEKRNLKPLDFNNVHLTLRFVGSRVSPATAKLLAAELQKNSGNFPKPQIHISKLSFGFYKQHDPRVLMATVSSNYELDELVDALHRKVRGLKRTDVIPWKDNDEEDYHISIARLKPNAPRAVGKRITDLLQTVQLQLPEDFTAEDIHLVQSEITSQGPKYRKLERIVL